MATKLFVGNLSYQTTEDGLRVVFEGDDRKVESVTIVSDRGTGRSRGFGFVEMVTEDDANAAIDKINGQELDGRPRTGLSHPQPRITRPLRPDSQTGLRSRAVSLR